MSDDSPVAGSFVDIAPWAYDYRKGSTSNAPETQWLWKTGKITRAASEWTFADYEPLRRVCPKERVLRAFLWEETRSIQRVEVGFSALAGSIPAHDEIYVLFASTRTPWQSDEDAAQFYPTTDPVFSSGNGTVYRYGIKNNHWGVDSYPGMKLYVVYTGRDQSIAIPAVRAYSLARWKAPRHVSVEWAFGDGMDREPRGGRAEVYNGVLGSVGPLEPGNGIDVAPDRSWHESGAATHGAPGRRGIRLQLSCTEGALDSQTIATVWTSRESFSFHPDDLDSGPILIPSIGICVSLASPVVRAGEFAREVSGRGMKTVRQRVREHEECTVEGAMRAFREGGDLPPFPEPPFEAPMKVDVPDPRINDQWKVGAWHLLRLSHRVDAKRYCISIFPPNYEVAYCGGIVALAQESYQIIRMLDLMGMGDVAEAGLNYWLFGEHAVPFVWHGELMGDRALINPYNSPDRLAAGYDQKHSSGHGRILGTAAFHYMLTESAAWYKEAEPVLERACQAIIDVRQRWMKDFPADSWVYGLIPPSINSDHGRQAVLYHASMTWYSGLKAAAEILCRNGSTAGPGLLREADLCLQDLRKSAERSIVLTPVVRVQDGTYRRYASGQPYMRNVNFQNQWFECVFGGLILAGTVFGHDEPVVQDMRDVNEDVILPLTATLHPAQTASDEDWFRRGGLEGGVYANQHLVHLLNDDILLYLRSVFNAYAATVDPDNGYVFWEGPFKSGSHEKPCEEAAFLERIRMMLIMEESSSLWLAKAAPRAWFGHGKIISVREAPTFFGVMSYSIISDVDHGRICAEITPPSRSVPSQIILRLRHPRNAAMRSVTVNGRPWTDFSPDREAVRLHGFAAELSVTAQY